MAKFNARLDCVTNMVTFNGQLTIDS